jgi:hypothetical protein
VPVYGLDLRQGCAARRHTRWFLVWKRLRRVTGSRPTTSPRKVCTALRALQPTPRIGLVAGKCRQHVVPGMTGAVDSGQIRSAVTQVSRRGADLRAIDD